MTRRGGRAFGRRCANSATSRVRPSTMNYRYSEGAPDRLATVVGELIRRPVDLIATFGTPPTQAAQAATTTIPIVMIGIGDAVRAGLVASLADHRLPCAAPAAGHVLCKGERGGGRIDGLRRERARPVSAWRRLCAPHPARRQSR